MKSLHAPKSLKGFGTTKRPGGRTQVTFHGRPLYQYVGDKMPGQTGGEGMQNAWFALRPNGTIVIATAPAPLSTQPVNPAPTSSVPATSPPKTPTAVAPTTAPSTGSAINSSPDNGALDDRSPNDDDHTDHGPFGGRLRVLSAALPVEGELTCPPDGLSILSNPLCLAARRTFCTRRTFCNERLDGVRDDNER